MKQHPYRQVTHPLDGFQPLQVEHDSEYHKCMKGHVFYGRLALKRPIPKGCNFQGPILHCNRWGWALRRVPQENTEPNFFLACPKCGTIHTNGFYDLDATPPH